MPTDKDRPRCVIQSSFVKHRFRGNEQKKYNQIRGWAAIKRITVSGCSAFQGKERSTKIIRSFYLFIFNLSIVCLLLYWLRIVVYACMRVVPKHLGSGVLPRLLTRPINKQHLLKEYEVIFNWTGTVIIDYISLNSCKQHKSRSATQRKAGQNKHLELAFKTSRIFFSLFNHLFYFLIYFILNFRLVFVNIFLKHKTNVILAIFSNLPEFKRVINEITHLRLHPVHTRGFILSSSWSRSKWLATVSKVEQVGKYSKYHFYK